MTDDKKVENFKPLKSQQPGVEFEGEVGEVTSDVYRVPIPNEVELLRDSGYDPDKWQITEPPKISTWDQQYEGNVIRMWSYKFTPRPKTTFNEEDLREVRKRLLRHKPPRIEVDNGDLAMVINLADWQVGKAQGWRLGGSNDIEDFVSYIKTMIEDVRKRAFELRKIGRKIDTLIIAGLGDMVESCEGHYTTQTFTVEANRKQQILIIVDLLIEAMISWAKLAPKIIVTAVPGNHGENRKDGRAYTTKGDNDDLLVFELLKRSLEVNPAAYGHVEFLIPDEEIYSIIEVHGKKIGFAHGHISGSGATPQVRIKNWWHDHSFGKSPLAEVDILVTGHYHHFSIIEYDEGRIHVQSPTADMGSPWFEDLKGLKSRSGTLTFLVGGIKPLQDIEIL